MSPVRPIRLYRFALSGHSHRVELFLSLLGLPFERISVDLLAGEHKSAAFLAMNPFGQVPVIDDDGVIVTDSNAILVYLATRYAPGTWLPTDPVGAAAVQRWLSVAAGPLAYGPAAARRITVFRAPLDATAVIASANALLGVLDGVLNGTPWLVGSTPTLADIALYTYVAHAPEGNVDLAPYAAVRRWLGRIEALPGFVPMAHTPVGLAG